MAHPDHACPDPIVYTSQEVGRLSAVTYRMLDYWCRVGLLEADNEGRGSGVPRGFSARQAALCCVLGAARAAGAGRPVLEALRDHFRCAVFSGFVAVPRGQAATSFSSTELGVLMGMSTGPMWLFDLDNLCAAVPDRPQRRIHATAAAL